MPGRLFPALLLLLGLGAVALFGLGLWNALTYTFAGQTTTGKVIEFHKTGTSRSASIAGEVQVDMPGRAPLRVEVDDALGAQDWAVGSSVTLRCVRMHEREPSCTAAPGWSILLFPLLFTGIGVGMVWWSVRRLRAKPVSTNRFA